MRALLANQAQSTAAITKEDQILTEQANPFRPTLRQFALGRYRVPITTEKVTHRGARSDASETSILFRGQHARRLRARRRRTSAMTTTRAARPTYQVDPVTYQVILSRLDGIVQEMQYCIYRTGYSTIIRETHDASCLLMDAHGDIVGQFAVASLHPGTLAEVTRSIIRTFGDDIHPGDAFITNHPYMAGTPHSIDMAVITPFFHNGRLVAFSGGLAHKSDLGGPVRGSGNAQAREPFQECTLYPPVRLVKSSVWQGDIERILRANSRTPDLIMGDIRGQIGVARLGEERLAETIAKHGVDALLEVFERVKYNVEDTLRAAIANWPDGTTEGESFVDTDGIDLVNPVRYHVKVTKTGDRIHFDMSGSANQVQGPINIQPTQARAALYYSLVAFVDQQTPINGGVREVVETTFRPGSVVCANWPAASGMYMASCMAVAEAALQALAQLVPEKRHANNGGAGGNVFAGTRPEDGSSFIQYELIGSALGANAHGDGASGLSVLLNNAHTAPIEIIESEYPSRVRRFELIQDSGGAGKFRGGLAPRRHYDILTDDAHWTLRGGRHRLPAFGVDGGAPGSLGRCIRNPGTPDETLLPSRFSNIHLKVGDIAAIEKPGGGGLGDVRERPFERVLDDVIDGYVSRAAAIDIYGVDAHRLDAALAAWNDV
jgi:N-methylhydantoinase B